MTRYGGGSGTELKARFEDKDTDTQDFVCMNDDCGKKSPVHSVEWYFGKYVIECPRCCQWHELRRLVTLRGAPLEFVAVGKLESE